MQRLIALIFVILLLGACAPTYDVTYHFEPPEKIRGKHCVNKCLDKKQKCRKDCTIFKNNCIDQSIESRAIRDSYTLLLLERGVEAHQQNHNHYHFYELDQDRCKYEEDTCKDTCEDDYRDCYINCGGRVSQQTICTSNCPR